MNRLAAVVLVSVVWSVPLLGQNRDRSLERIRVALEQPRLITGDGTPVEAVQPKTLGILTLQQPTLPGEVIRVSVPIGELVSRAFKGSAAAYRRRQVAAARRDVEAELERMKQRQPPPRE